MDTMDGPAAGDTAEGFASLATDRLESQIRAMAARRAADDAAWLALIAEFDRREAYLGWECRSTAHWLNWHCGIGLGAGRERVRVGRALERLPVAAAAFAAGRLTFSKMRALSRVASPATEQSFVDLALAATAAQLERICAAFRTVRRPDADDEPHAQQLRTWHDDHGLGRLEATIAPQDFALIEAALASTVEHLNRGACHSGVSAERFSRADALVELARQHLSATAPSPHVERRHLVILADASVLTRQGDLGIDDDGRCTFNGQRLDPATARRLGATAALTTILLDHRGLPLSVGRRSRTATPAQRLALLVRDGGCCRYPGCASPYVDAHHILEWDNLGLTDLINLLLLCRFHHRHIHHSGYTITYDPDTNTVTITRPDGTTVTAPVPTDDAPDPPAVADDALQPGEAGTRLELDDIIEGLLRQADHPPEDQ